MYLNRINGELIIKTYGLTLTWDVFKLDLSKEEYANIRSTLT